MTYAIQTVNSARIAKFGSGAVIMRSATPLDDDDTLARYAPSVFAEAKHNSRSARYTYIPTSEVLKGLRNEGFMPFEVRQGGSRDDEKRGFTKHLIRFRHSGGQVVGDSHREVVLLNSHDGTSSYQLMSGIFRLVCSNGLVVADGCAQSIRIPHKGDIVGQVIDAAYQVIDQGEEIDRNVESMRQLQLTVREQEAFAEAASALRWPVDDGKAPVEPSAINLARREADRGDDLWRTFNRQQENLVRGGLGYVQRDERGYRIARRETRPVNSIDANTNLNKALWTLAERMRELKA